MFLFNWMVAYAKIKFLGIPMPFYPIFLAIVPIILWEIIKRRPTTKRRKRRNVRS